MKKQRRLERQKNKNKKTPVGLWIAIPVAIVVIIILFLIFKVLTLDKFIYVNKGDEGSAEIIIIDSTSDRNLKYLVQKDTMLDSARGYGTYKISSLWSLSEKDNNGKLIPETIAKNYSLPIYLWKDGGRSNLDVFQKIRLLFTPTKKIIATKIEDTKLPNSILIQFVEPNLTDMTPKIDVEDLTDSFDTLDKVSKVIEVVGGKITSNSKGFDADLDCEIYGKDPKLTHIFSLIFSCHEKNDKTLTSDLKIRLGAKFAERF